MRNLLTGQEDNVSLRVYLSHNTFGTVYGSLLIGSRNELINFDHLTHLSDEDISAEDAKKLLTLYNTKGLSAYNYYTACRSESYPDWNDLTDVEKQEWVDVVQNFKEIPLGQDEMFEKLKDITKVDVFSMIKRS